MIQRIQTVYLLLVVVLLLATLFMPLLTLQIGQEFFSMDASGVSSLINQEATALGTTWGLFALTAIIALVAMVTIFLYKNRILQIRLCVFNALLMIGFYAYVAFLVWRWQGEVPEMQWQLKLGLAFPVIALILDYLAIRNIGADEALVRSLDRLR